METNLCKDKTEDHTSENIHFNPPLYLQRYHFVSDLLQKHGVKSVVDFGCSNCKMLRYLLAIDSLTSVTLVDNDEQILLANKHTIRPLILDQVIPLRKCSVNVSLYRGSVVDYDARLDNCDCVTMVELIEHLTEPELENFPRQLFGSLKAKLVIITTPNSEFNVLFPDPQKFRHWDHKFEWNRNQFRDWCNTIARQYGYSVTFTGVGSPPDGWEHVGHCSQAAIFILTSECIEIVTNTSLDTNELIEISHPYRLIESCVYPCRADLSPDLQLDYDITYYINYLSHPSEVDRDGNSFVQIDTLSKLIKSLSPNIDKKGKLLSILRSKGYNISDDKRHVVIHMSSDSSSSDEDDRDHRDNRFIQFSDSTPSTEFWGDNS